MDFLKSDHLQYNKVERWDDCMIVLPSCHPAVLPSDGPICIGQQPTSSPNYSQSSKLTLNHEMAGRSYFCPIVPIILKIFGILVSSAFLQVFFALILDQGKYCDSEFIYVTLCGLVFKLLYLNLLIAYIFQN